LEVFFAVLLAAPSIMAQDKSNMKKFDSKIITKY